ncbi:succinylglutamate desuccinylase [Planctobacterium marinum]|uniref:succinylglutamate desuccinylase n=1 Tax=Planctobacterium marinum TaxID=1631968 RepID=UPI001E5C9E3E|nr:succinylglutamate desuccinylase [Planctobacterium marinum]MCC2604289.1 succinylglutamate desuccinylase [Planctobacterium marinum]
MSKTIDLLLAQGNFLQLSRKSPELFAHPLQFTLSNQTTVQIHSEGVIQFEPANYGAKDIVYSCGVHGNETAPIEICDDIVQAVLREELQLAHRLLVLFGNLPAMDIAQRFVHENMNRLFDGEHSNPQVDSNPERKRAKHLEERVRDFFLSVPGGRQRYHYDLHTAIRDSKNEKFAVYPFTHGRARNPEQLVFLQQCGVSTILLSESPTTTFSYFSCKHFHADAFTVELGKVRPFGENDMSRFAAAKRMLQRWATESEVALPEFDETQFHIYRVNQIINRHKPEFVLHFEDDTPNFTDYPKGTLLASEPGAEYRAEQDGEAIVFPNARVALGQRALLTVVPTSLKDK